MIDTLALIQRQGKCRTYDLEIFFPPYDSPSANAQAIAVCGRCPVRAECLEWALDNLANEDDGVWGGTGPADRRALLRTRERVHCVICRSTDIIEVDGHEVCKSCGTSWPV